MKTLNFNAHYMQIGGLYGCISFEKMADNN